jgi:hypothetical protein
LVAPADAFMLAEVLGPGADNELLEDVSGISRVAPHGPTNRARAESGAAPGVERLDELSLKARPRPVLNLHLHDAVSRGRGRPGS